MPELPEVQATVNSVRPFLEGRRIAQVCRLRGDLVRPRGFALASRLPKDPLVSVTRRAKRIVLAHANELRWFVHLGMSGRLVVVAPGEPVVAHTHAIFRLDDGNELRFIDPRRFGKLVWLGSSPDDPSLGPEPLTLSLKDFVTRLQRTGRAIKTALLDQHLVAGIGNIYADESLHAAGIHPRQPSNRLTRAQSRRLLQAIKAVLRRAIRSGGSTIRNYVNGNSQPGTFQQQLAVYGRAGQPCRRCRTPIVRVVLGGRGTHFCPTCQKQPPRALSRVNS